ncbi:MAG: hypothetical protein FWH47_04520, partial [Methanomassiliicoccaceae archaeon]|nr:hypothetical protein [Methanomassiliicoccaceae archaeon]
MRAQQKKVNSKRFGKRPAMIIGALVLIMTVAAAFTLVSSPSSTDAATNVPYIDENGVTQIQPSATDITGPTTTITAGWYLLSGTFSQSYLEIYGDVHLILADNCNVTFNGVMGASNARAAININATSDASLTIYAQSTGSSMGTITAIGGTNGFIEGTPGIGTRAMSVYGVTSSLTINGGKINATGGGGGIGGGFAAPGIGVAYMSNGIFTVTINGGVVTATGVYDGGGISSGGYAPAGSLILTINGGTVNAYGGPNSGLNSPLDGGSGVYACLIMTGGTLNAYGYDNRPGILSSTSSPGGLRPVVSGGTINAVGNGTAPGILFSSSGIVYGNNTFVTAYSTGSGGNITSSANALFVMLPLGNLKGASSANIGNTVLFTADPASASGTVQVTLPSTYSPQTLDLMTGLDQTGKSMSVITAGSGSDVFSLAGYPDVTRSMAQLITAGTTVPFQSHDLSLSAPSSYTFPAANYGYPAQSPYSVTVTASGPVAPGSLSISLSGSNAGAFTLSKTTGSIPTAGGTDSFTVEPNTGLAPGTYTATVTVASGLVSKSFIVSFTVNTGPTYNVNLNITGDGSVTIIDYANGASFGTYSASTTVAVPQAVADLLFAATDGSDMFEKFTVDGVDSFVNPTTSPFTGNMNLGAVFLNNLSNYYQVTVSMAGDGAVAVGSGAAAYGTVTVSPSVVNVPDSVSDIRLTAYAGAGYVFESFTIDSSTTSYVNPTVTPIGGNMAVAALFTDSLLFDCYVVDVTITGDGTVEVSDSSVSYGTVATPSATVNVPKWVFNLELTATEGYDHTFDRFEVFPGGVTSSANPFAIPISTDVSIGAYFTVYPWLHIDLANSDTSLYGTVANNWIPYYEYNQSTHVLTIKQNAPTGKTYRIWEDSSGHGVEAIVFNSAVSAATVVIDDINVDGRIDLQGGADVTLRIPDGTSSVIDNSSGTAAGIRVPSTATLTIEGEALGTGSIEAIGGGNSAGIGGNGGADGVDSVTPGTPGGAAQGGEESGPITVDGCIVIATGSG